MTLAAITMTAPEAASPVQMYRATYSPDDNKLRLYAASRLDQETYKKVHDAGFRWAPKQALFVAPAWTPGREDVLLSLAGEIEDEDSTLAERQEARAERFTGYSGKRASESAQVLDEVERLAAMIPPGQPILVGHHSERRARRDAQRIENGMKRAVMLFERAEYWEERARSALLHAKYKERPDVRWRRIKKIEADLRKAEKTIAQSQKYLTMWRAESLDLNMAKLISSHDHISACFPLDTYPRPAEKSQYEGSRSLWSALDDDIITTEQAREIAIRCHERQIQHQQRWVIRAMMEGGTAKIYHCNDSDKCLKVVADTPVTISRDNALKSQITKLLASIQNKAVSDTPLDDKEKGFISSTTIPVFKYLVDPQMLGVSNSMIYQLTDYIGYDILLQYIQELIQQARAMVATGNYDEAVIEHINDNMNDATRQIAAFQSQVQVQQDALLVVDRQMSYMRQQLSARMLSRYQNNYHFGGSTL
ncbi:DUF3560 domain-containing protein [Escherichia coli]|uniref:DUF3560 domain-containing protein n=14 Tax=Escherichia coli TaxID=562 RepID=UPI003457BB3B